MMMFDGISVGSGTFSHLPPSNVAGLAVVLGALEGGGPAALPLLPLRRCCCSAAAAAAASCNSIVSVLHGAALPPCDAVGRRAGLGLTAVWCALAGFYLTRLGSHLLFYWWSGGGAFAGRTKLSSKVE